MLPVPDSPCGFSGRKATLIEESAELRNCVKIEVDVQVSVVVKQHRTELNRSESQSQSLEPS